MSRCVHVRTYERIRKKFTVTDSTAIDHGGRTHTTKYTRGAIVLASEFYPRRKSARK